MTTTSFGIVSSLSEAQPENTAFPSVLTLSGMVIASSAVQPEKRDAGKEFMPSGSTALRSFKQFENAPSPSFVTVSGIVIISKQAPENALLPISVTVSGTIYAPSCLPTG